jgi:Ca-activated chloride channel family protein
VVLHGTVNGEEQTFTYEGQSLVTEGGNQSLPRLWATRKIGYLLTQIRLYGENSEWIQAIVDLSVRYGIVTPYTSYLLTEDDILTSGGRANAAADQEEAMAQSTAEPSGAAAVGQAEDEAQLAGGTGGDAAPAPSSGEYADQVIVIGSRAFLLLDGVWTETTFDPSTMTTVKVQFLSDDYFALLAAHPDLAAPFGLGERVIAFSGGIAFEVTAEEQPPLDPAYLGA